MSKLSAEDLRSQLAFFTGSEGLHYCPPFNDLKYTDGVQFLFANAECYWLLNEIWAGAQTPKVKSDPLVFWKLTVNPDRSAELTAVHDSGCAPYYHQNIPWTDFPLDEITIYMDNMVLLLPSEY